MLKISCTGSPAQLCLLLTETSGGRLGSQEQLALVNGGNDWLLGETVGAQSPVLRSVNRRTPRVPSRLPASAAGSEQVGPMVGQEDLGSHSFATCEVKGASPSSQGKAAQRG